MHRECRERFPRHWLPRKPRVNELGMHYGTCVTHVPCCTSGSLTHGAGENVPGISGTCATRNFTYLVRGLLDGSSKISPTDLGNFNRYKTTTNATTTKKKTRENAFFLLHISFTLATDFVSFDLPCQPDRDFKNKKQPHVYSDVKSNCKPTGFNFAWYSASTYALWSSEK